MKLTTISDDKEAKLRRTCAYNNNNINLLK